MRTIVIGDIHGCYEELEELIMDMEEDGAYNKETDKLIFLGDYIDRGSDSRKVIEFIRGLQKNNDKVIALMGNHEDMMLNYYKGIDNTWLWNGHYTTMDSYEGYDKQLKDDMKWIRELPLYHEDENFIYVHAGIDVEKPMREQNKFTLLWVREDFIWEERKYHKKVIFGHTVTASLNGKDKPLYTIAGNVAIDTGCVYGKEYGGALTALIIDDGEINGFYQTYKEEEKINI